MISSNFLDMINNPKMNIRCVLILAFLTLVSADDYKMNGNIVCTSWHNVTHLCNSWSVSTKISASGSCFPGDTLIRTDQGYKMISDLTVGDIMYGYNHTTQSITTTPFTRWLHFEKNGEYEFVEIQTASSSLIASAYHNIAFWSDDNIIYDYAKNCDKYSALFNGTNPIPIIGSKTVMKKGIYAPLTGSYNFVVTQSDFLVHAFAHVKYPQMVQSVFGAALWAIDAYLGTIIQTEFSNVTEYYDPSIKYLVNMFGGLTDIDAPVSTIRRLRGSSGSSGSTGSSGAAAQSQENQHMRMLMSVSNLLVAHVVASGNSM